jgi:hypothetical protein
MRSWAGDTFVVDHRLYGNGETNLITKTWYKLIKISRTRTGLHGYDAGKSVKIQV